MTSILSLMDAVQRRDPHRMILAPLFGLCAGFLTNRLHNGGMGGALAAEMLAGAVIVTLAALLARHLAAMAAEARADRIAAQRAAVSAELARQAEAHRLRIAAEAAHFTQERLFREQTLNAAVRVGVMERELMHSRHETRQLRDAIMAMRGSFDQGAGNSLLADIKAANERILALEHANAEVLEATHRLAGLEQAQNELTRQHIKLTQTQKLEVEEVKNHLRLAISDSQRQRNIEGPENAESGRIVELEQRIKKLARELEKLSTRTGVVDKDEGVASLVAPGGTREVARAGFLKALLDANQTLRKQIRAAA
ncbi:MAG: hypothetical protein IT462_03895 [Planctomycetes bacterium]|nr:hypothetical protein [Planctomycetota bacterium]